MEEYIKNLGPSFKYAEVGERLEMRQPSRPTATSTLAPSIQKILVDSSVEIGQRPTATDTPALVPSIRKTMIDLLDKNEEEFEALKESLSLEYEDKIGKLESQIVDLKRKHEDCIQSLKQKKFCDCCYNVTETEIKIFCSNSCGSKW